MDQNKGNENPEILEDKDNGFDRWTIEEVNELLNLTRKGCSPAMVATRTGIPKQRVMNKLYSMRKALSVDHTKAPVVIHKHKKRSLWEIMFGASR